MRKMVLALLVLFAAVGPLCSQKATPSHLSQDIDGVVLDYMKTHSIPGLSLAVRGRLTYAKGYGLADLESHAEVTPTTVFGTASALKILTATAVLQLAEQGKIDLNSPIERYCREFPRKHWAVSAAQLLSHQGGLGESKITDIFRRDHFATVHDAVLDFANDVFEPGTDVIYSNHGYALLACAIEGASGVTYEEYIRAHILVPAGMTRSFPIDVYAVVPNRARSYLIRTEENTKELEGIWKPAHLSSIRVRVPAVADPIDPSSDPGAGNYFGTPGDMVRFVLALDSGQLLTESMRRQEFVDHPTQLGKYTSRGWGWIVTDLNGEHVAQVLGSDWNTSFGVLTIPEKHFVVSVASNIQFDQPSDLVRQIARLYGCMMKNE